MILAPQPGPQQAFASCSADICFYGGAAGGGKTWILEAEPLHYAPRVRGFHGVIFRRTYPEITNPGGLWDESLNLYPHTGAVGTASALRWHWPKTDSSIKFAHMQHEKDVHGWQGAQLAFIGFDELTHFSRRQFFYLLSRARTACGVNPYVRATMNPDPDSWVREFIDWYLGPDGQAIPERSGVVRYFARVGGDRIEWADSAETLTLLGLRPRSFTFIAAKVDDNKILLNNNPDYLANLEALPLIDRERLRVGNWNIRPVAGNFFRRSWFPILSAAPTKGRRIRYWDRAATEPSPANPDPDWTVGMRMIREPDGGICVDDVVRVRLRAEGVLRTIKATAAADGPGVEQWLEEDPGQAGQAEKNMYWKEMSDVQLRFLRPLGSKVKRALPASAQAEAGRIRVVRGPWLADFFSEVERFADWDSIPKQDRPAKPPHDDQVDTLSGGVAVLVTGGTPTAS